MRVFVIAAAAIALMTAPASAQGMGKQRREPDQKTDPNKDAKRKADEKAYYDALSKIPNAKQPYDPWKIER
jgi:hypothetical protein